MSRYFRIQHTGFSCKERRASRGSAWSTEPVAVISANILPDMSSRSRFLSEATGATSMSVILFLEMFKDFKLIENTLSVGA